VVGQQVGQGEQPGLVPDEQHAGGLGLGDAEGAGERRGAEADRRHDDVLERAGHDPGGEDHEQAPEHEHADVVTERGDALPPLDRGRLLTGPHDVEEGPTTAGPLTTSRAPSSRGTCRSAARTAAWPRG
jgi:hypothetical protein